MIMFQSLHHALSVQQFLYQIVDDLVSYQKSVIVVLPAGIDPADVWELIRSELDRRQPDLREMPLSDLDEHPVVALESFFDIAHSAQARSRTLEAFFERGYADGVLPDILYLEQLQHLSGAAVAEWLALLTRWATLNQGITHIDRRRTALCVVVPAELVLDRLPDANVHLALHWWWGLPSASETQMLYRYNASATDNRCLTRWREHLLASLATGDAAFLAYLQPYVDQCDTAIEQHVLNFAMERGWTATLLRDAGAQRIVKASPLQGERTSPAPPAALHQLWALGALGWTPEYGIELHTAAVACLGLHNEFRHRMWRGQVPFIYPTIDYLRLIVCNWLTEKYGRTWPVKWRRPEDERLAEAVERDPNVCELSHLVSLLERNVSKEGKEKWYRLVAQLTQIRNKLAHYCPISFAEFEQLWKLADETIQSKELPVAVV